VIPGGEGAPAPPVSAKPAPTGGAPAQATSAGDGRAGVSSPPTDTN
jgi:hypothetical protein